MKTSLTLSTLSLLLGFTTFTHAQELTSKKKQSSDVTSKPTLPNAAQLTIIEDLKNLIDQSKEHPTAIETIEAAQASDHDDVKLALKRYKNKVKKLSPLAKWLPALHGGDAAKGEQIFLNHPKALCSSCHQGSKESNQLGPDLTGIATQFNHLRKDLLAALVTPSASIAEGYGTVTVEFKQGQVTGKILAYKPAGLVVEINGNARLISHSDYTNLSFQKSEMPPAHETLDLREIRDLVAYLATLTGPSKTSETANINATPYSPTELTKVDLSKEVDKTIKQRRLYLTNCAACHLENGEGNETFPPLAKSEWVSGDKETLIKIQLLGLQGPIKVRDKIYDNNVPMPSNAHLSNEDMADILTYIRTDPTFGNNASIITSEEIVEARAAFADETGLLDASTLTHPDSIQQVSNNIVKTKKDNESKSYLAYLIGFIILCTIPVVIGFIRNNKPTTK